MSVALVCQAPAELSAIEQGRLRECETRIERGIAVFVDVGNALLEIRDSRLYRQNFPTFEAYCRERWGLSRPRAYQLLEAAEVVNNVSTIVDIAPATESQARPLTRLEPEVQREVWQELVESTPVERITAKVVEEQAKAAEPLNEAVKTIKEELKAEPPAQQSILPEPPAPKDRIIVEATEKVKAGTLTVLQAAKEISQATMKVEIAAARALRPKSPGPTPEVPLEPPPRDPVFDTVLPNGKPIGEGDPKALWLWGWLLEYEDRFLKSSPDPETLASNFLDFMDRDSQRLIPIITRYLNSLLETLHANAS